MNEEEIYKMLLTENIEKFPLLNEIFAIRNNKFKINDYTIYVTGCISLDVINREIEKANTIDKLQKENEELKEQKKTCGDAPESAEKFISVAKIKEALGNKSIPNDMILTYIDTLVSENNRLEDIEDTKIQIEYNNVFNKSVKSVEDKIRTKIKELEESKDKEEYIDEYGVRNIPVLNAFIDLKIEILKELLGDDE